MGHLQPYARLEAPGVEVVLEHVLAAFGPNRRMVGRHELLERQLLANHRVIPANHAEMFIAKQTLDKQPFPVQIRKVPHGQVHHPRFQGFECGMAGHGKHLDIDPGGFGRKQWEQPRNVVALANVWGED